MPPKKKKSTKKVTIGSKTQKGTTRRKNMSGKKPKSYVTGPRGPRRTRRQKNSDKAYVNEMRSVTSGVSVTFNGKSGMKNMHIRFRVAQIFADSTGLLVQFKVNSGNLCYAIPFALVNGFYFPSYIYNLARLFEEWELHKASVEYEPRVNTSSTCSFTIAGMHDQVWFGSHSQTSGTFPLPTEAGLASLSDCCTVAAYRPCKLNLPINTNEGKHLYTAAPFITTQIAYANGYDALIRASTGATVAICGVAGNSAASTLIGDLYCNLTFSLYEFSTAISATIYLGSAERQAREEKNRERWEVLEPSDVPSSTLAKPPLSREPTYHSPDFNRPGAGDSLTTLWGRTKSPG